MYPAVALAAKLQTEVNDVRATDPLACFRPKEDRDRARL